MTQEFYMFRDLLIILLEIKHLILFDFRQILVVFSDSFSTYLVSYFHVRCNMQYDTAAPAQL